MPIVSSVWPPMRSATMPVRMPLRAAYTAAAAPAGPPPTISTSKVSLAAIFAASRAAAPVSTLARISVSSMRPLPNGWPFRKTSGTARIWRSSTSFWNRPPSIATWRMRGFSTAIRLIACTTSGQLWQVRLIQVSNTRSASSDLIWSICSCSIFGGWPPACSSASTSDVNSWPIGMAANVTPMSAPARVIWNDGRRAACPSKRAVSSGDSAATSVISSRISCAAGLSSSDAISSTGCVTRAR